MEPVTLVVVLGLLILYVSRPIWDIDLFWHIAAGRFFLANGAIPTTDIFSAIEPDRTWVTFQWGYQVLVHALEQAGGLQVVRGVHGLVMWSSFALLAFVCRRHLRLGGLGTVLVVALMIVLFEDRIRVRPHVFNLLGWVVLLPLLLRGSATTEPEGLRSRPIVFDLPAHLLTALTLWFWANIHAGGAFLFLVAAATIPTSAIIARWLSHPEASPESLRSSLTWYASALLPALMAPHFVRGNIQALTMLEGTESAIGEWLPSWHFFEVYELHGLESHLVCGAFPTLVALGWMVVAWGWMRSRGRDAPFRVVLLGLALVVLSHRSVRFVYVAGFGALLLAPWLRTLITWPRFSRVWAPRLGLLAVASLMALSYDFNVRAQGGDLSTTVQRAFASSPMEEARFPTAQAEFLERTGFQGGIFCQANWGGYLLWKLHPDVTVTADGRGNYPASVTRDLGWLYDRQNHLSPANGAEALAIYERYPVDAIVHQHPAWPGGFEPPRSDWVRVYSDVKGTIWVRNTPKGRVYLRGLQDLRTDTESP